MGRLTGNDNVKFGIASPRNVSFRHSDDSGYSKAEWSEMSERERDDALREWLFEQVEAWVEDDD